MQRLPSLFAACLVTALLQAAADEADAPPLTPQEQLSRFSLPPGFEIQLVASEPEIQKPMNLNFDAAGRLWVSGTSLYPLAAKTDALGRSILHFEQEWNSMAGAAGGEKPDPPTTATDTVRVLEDFGPNGRARKISVFADGLNIPIGIQPLPPQPGVKGSTALVFSIPSIWRMTDRDGDGQADLREELYSGFGFKDTHGMSSNYLQWTDGWIYACHGFANHSQVSDRSGRVTLVDSGNICRFKADGSRFEIFGNGQTNPFGLTVDDRGNLYSADSHSKPAYLILQGAHAEGIGKHHDGLGFLPPIMRHSHGSSAIAGIAFHAASSWPEEYRGNLFIGNPVTRRINRDRLEWHGATPEAIELPDFLSCDDPWFRPIQVKLGPDNALYIADFYNPIIGHYEHPLFDPRRDQVHGRIWRIVWKGDSAGPEALPDLIQLDGPELVAKFTDPNTELRRLAMLLAQARGLELPEPPRAPSSLLPAETRGIPGLLALWKETSAQDALTRHALRVALRDGLLNDATAFSSAEVTQADEDSARLLAEVSLAVPTPAAADFLLRHLSRGGHGDPSAEALFKHMVRHLPPQRYDELLGLAARLGDSPGTVQLDLAEAILQADPIDPAADGGGLEKLHTWAEQVALENLGAGDAAATARAIALIKDLPSPAKAEPLLRLLSDAAAPEILRATALAALANLPEAIPAATQILKERSSPPALSRQAVEMLARSLSPEAEAALLNHLATAPADITTLIAGSLASRDDSFDRLLDQVASGGVSPAVLRHRHVADAFAARPEHLRNKAAALTEDLPPEDDRLIQLSAERAARFAGAEPDEARGQAIFATHCAACHKFKDEGGNLAPNLDGVGSSRGAARLIEDILDPHRNVDPSFRLITLIQHDGTSTAGINLREDASQFRLTDATGNDIEVPRRDVREVQPSLRSIMPAVFDQTVPEADFYDLIAYLLKP